MPTFETVTGLNSNLIELEKSNSDGMVFCQCPLCASVFRDDSAHWHNVNVSHITRGHFLLSPVFRNVAVMCVIKVASLILNDGILAVVPMALAIRDAEKKWLVLVIPSG